MSDSHITTRVEDTLYYVTLDRAEKRNAITTDMMFDLENAFQDVDNYPAVRAVIVSGEGPLFSAGIDLMNLAQTKSDQNGANPSRWLRRFADRLQYVMHVIESTEVPVIGALHGRVMGLGLELALAFDLRVATESCRFSFPEARMGLVADVGGTTRIARTCGPSRAKDMLMTAREVPADEALRWGLVDRVVPDGTHIDAAKDLAAQIAKNAPLAVGLSKLIVDQGDGLDKQTQMAIERLAQSQLITTEDNVEAVTSFFEKRDPAFKGR